MKRFQPILAALILSVSLFACEKEMLTPEGADQPTAQLMGQEGLIFPDSQCATSIPIDIVDEFNAVVGTVTIANDENDIYFVFDMQPGKFLTRIELYAGLDIGIPKKGNRMDFESFPNQLLIPAGSAAYTVTIPNQNLPSCPEVVIHGVVANKDWFGNLSNSREVFMSGTPILNGQSLQYCRGLCGTPPGPAPVIGFN